MKLNRNKYCTDVVIIGGGPVGIFAVFQLGMLGISSYLLDALPQLGGQCTALYPEKPIYDIPGYTSISGRELIDNLVAQAAPFRASYMMGKIVTNITKHDEYLLLVETDCGTQIDCKAVIIAAGSGAFGPNRPPLEGIRDYEEEQSVRYCITRVSDFADKHVVIAGGGDSAADWAVELAKYTKSLHIVHRRQSFRCAPETVKKLEEGVLEGKINMAIPYQLSGLKGNGKKLEAVLVRSIDGTNEKILQADFLLPFFGITSNLGPITKWGLRLQGHHIIVDPTTLQTSTAGIYAVGDIATYNNKIKLILIGFSEVALACHHLYQRIKPNVPLHFQYSTSKGVSS